MAVTVYKKTLLTGGTAAALDSIDGNLLLDENLAFVDYSGVLYVYKLDDDLGGAESSPTIITPDTNPGNKRWVLQGTYGLVITAGKTITATQDTALDEAVAMSSKVNRGAESLKIWTYTHTITAAEDLANLTDITITAVVLAKVRSISVVILDGGMVWNDKINFLIRSYLTTTTNLRIQLAAAAVENDIISLTIIEAA